MNIGPLELVVIAVVGLIVLGPERLPGLARDAARMLRTLKELSTGARLQLRDQLGPEFADVDLRALNPRTAISNMLLGDDEQGPKMPSMPANPRAAFENFLSGDSPASAAPAGEVPAAAEAPVDLSKQQAPLGRGEAAPFDSDAT
jgi:sec-independent protein translocase protein TatB